MKFQNIHFISCSNCLSALEMADPLVQDLKMLEKGIKVFDAFCGYDIFIVTPVLCVLCDNVHVSKLLGHLGSKAKKLCRFCMVWAISDFFKVNIHIFVPFFQADSVNATITWLKRNKEMSLSQIKTVKSKAEKRTEYGLKEIHNTLFLLSTDLFQ